jgi:hypothetical protein
MEAENGNPAVASDMWWLISKAGESKGETFNPQCPTSNPQFGGQKLNVER